MTISRAHYSQALISYPNQNRTKSDILDVFMEVPAGVDDDSPAIHRCLFPHSSFLASELFTILGVSHLEARTPR